MRLGKQESKQVAPKSNVRGARSVLLQRIRDIPFVTIASRRSVEAGNDGSCRFLEDYPSYFAADDVLKYEYVTERAMEIANCLSKVRPNMTMHQLRAFYRHVKLQEGALDGGCPFQQVRLQICKLKPFASERASKRKIPPYFESFIRLNVEAVEKTRDEASFRKAFIEGFVEHFQAVVAYCAGTLGER